MPITTSAGSIVPAPFATRATRAALGTRALDFLRDEAGARQALAREAQLSPGSVVRARQVHGARVHALEAPPAAPPEGDALATRTPGLALVALGADCPGVALLADDVPAVAVAHSGWRGAVADVAPAAADQLAAWGARRERLRAWIGPGIGPCCFEVGDEVAAAFEAAFGPLGALARPGPRGRPHLDLAGIVLRRLVERAGLDPAHVARAPECTRCSPDRFFSRRGEGPACGHHGLAAWIPLPSRTRPD